MQANKWLKSQYKAQKEDEPNVEVVKPTMSTAVLARRLEACRWRFLFVAAGLQVRVVHFSFFLIFLLFLLLVDFRGILLVIKFILLLLVNIQFGLKFFTVAELLFHIRLHFINVFLGLFSLLLLHQPFPLLFFLLLLPEKLCCLFSLLLGSLAGGRFAAARCLRCSGSFASWPTTLLFGRRFLAAFNATIRLFFAPSSRGALGTWGLGLRGSLVWRAFLRGSAALGHLNRLILLVLHRLVLVLFVLLLHFKGSLLVVVGTHFLLVNLRVLDFLRADDLEAV